MTSLTKPVHRVTRGAYRVLYSAPREVVVSLLEGDLLGFREKGRKQVFTLPVDVAFRISVRNEANRQAQEKRLRKKNRIK